MAEEIVSPVQRDFTQERDDLCKPIAVELLRVIADEGDKLVIGSKVDEGAIVDYYSDIYAKIVPIFLSRADKLRVVDMDYCFRIAQQALQLMQDRVRVTIEQRHNQATAKLFGLKDVDELTLARLDEVLSKD